jgi:hypothetical protein
VYRPLSYRKEVSNMQFDKAAWESYLMALQLLNRSKDQLQCVPWKPVECLAISILQDAINYLSKQYYKDYNVL